jgi:hypothetical protein
MFMAVAWLEEAECMASRLPSSAMIVALCVVEIN